MDWSWPVWDTWNLITFSRLWCAKCEGFLFTPPSLSLSLTVSYLEALSTYVWKIWKCFFLFYIFLVLVSCYDKYFFLVLPVCGTEFFCWSIDLFFRKQSHPSLKAITVHRQYYSCLTYKFPNFFSQHNIYIYILH